MKRLFFVSLSCLLTVSFLVFGCTPKRTEKQETKTEETGSTNDAQALAANQLQQAKNTSGMYDSQERGGDQVKQTKEPAPLTDAQREELLASLKLTMLPVKEGSFERPLKDGGTKSISVDSFQMSQYEITVEQFRAFLKITNTEHVLNDKDDVGVAFQFLLAPVFIIPPDWPAVFVDFFNACKFCNWLSEREGLEPCYSFGTEDPKKPNDTKVTWDTSKNGYRLPTEAE